MQERVIIKSSPHGKVKLYKCPKCNEYLLRDSWGSKHCPNCNKELSWIGTGKKEKVNE
jgi:Zn finger protein HypA/HybF involved in hydrogenase expression